MPQSCVLNVNKKAAHTLIILIHNQSHTSISRLPPPAARAPRDARFHTTRHGARTCTDHAQRTSHGAGHAGSRKPEPRRRAEAETRVTALLRAGIVWRRATQTSPAFCVR